MSLTKQRPRRGTPEETRTRLVIAAAAEFNDLGFYGTDSNRIARAANYAPGTFYKHFPDKRAIFLAVYEAWIGAEYGLLAEIVAAGGKATELARRVVTAVLKTHRKWRVFRSSLRALVVLDPEVRAFRRGQGRRLLAMLAQLRTLRGRAHRTRHDDALLWLTMERVCDAIAEGETRELGLSSHELIELLVRKVAEHVS